MTFKILALSILMAALVSCAGDTSESSSEKEASNEQETASTKPISENATPVEASKALESGETWSLLTDEDVFTTKQDVIVYRTSEAVEELCILSPGLQFIILSKANSFYRIRLDRIAQDENCPLEEQSIGIVKSEDIESNSQAEFDVPGNLEPHTLTYDLKVFRTSEKTDSALCTIAKGNAVLVNPSDSSIQIPFSTQCGPDHLLGYYRYVPGIWWEDQPR